MKFVNFKTGFLAGQTFEIFCHVEYHRDYFSDNNIYLILLSDEAVSNLHSTLTGRPPREPVYAKTENFRTSGSKLQAPDGFEYRWIFHQYKPHYTFVVLDPSETDNENSLFILQGDDSIHIEMISLKQKKMFKSLYSTLTTTQVEKATRGAALTHEDWLDFVKLFKN